MTNITFNNNTGGRNNNDVTYISYPIRRDNSNASDIVTWADKIDWGEFDLNIFDDDPNTHSVRNSYESFVNALIANFQYLYNKINNTPQPIQYTVTLNIANGTISTDSIKTVESGGSVSWVVNPNTGYKLPSSISGATISGNTIIVYNVTSDKIINVNCVPQTPSTQNWFSYGITPITASNYTTANGATQVTSYPAEQTFTTPELCCVYVMTTIDKTVKIVDPIGIAYTTAEDTTINGYKITYPSVDGSTPYNTLRPGVDLKIRIS